MRIPYQQKRMFGFVTFVYPETVKLILAKGNPHFVCDSRVLVKPYKEKGKVPEKYRHSLFCAFVFVCITLFMWLMLKVVNALWQEATASAAAAAAAAAGEGRVFRLFEPFWN